jgi:hypothetical protein
LPTRVVIALSNGLVRFGPFIIAGAFLAAWAMKAFYATPRGRTVIDGFLLKVPVLGSLLRKDRGRALLPHALDAARLGRLDSRSAGHHRQDCGQRHR